ncbi:hypothetical protein GCM10011380_31090 [Sphingomonas metalli]|uniref:HTH luxR-type domain-containing protein n=1 Tax=Sphingomonas metalli TaxID=1779358 RepID=A0A916WY13_9SPHN|nr:hypothetical protein [Sphingomonas metalli]GGB39377.1 hypothetical protein GCM10011380_31090 [Sphingomonas metalli]
MLHIDPVAHAVPDAQRLLHRPPSPALRALRRAEPLDRFAEGLARIAGAAAAALLPPDAELHDTAAQPCGLATLAPGSDDALAQLVEEARDPTARAGWLHAAGAPEHRGLLVEPGARRGRLLLVFMAADLARPGAGERLLATVPALAAMAGPMQELWQALDTARERNRALLATLDHSECGILVVGEDHGVLVSNHAADAILADRDGVELRRGLLRPIRYQDAIRFQAALDQVLAMPAGGSQAERYCMMLFLDRGGEGRPLVMVIAPATPDEAEGRATAIVYVMRPEKGGLRGVEAICQLHGLSPVETQLVARLLGGATLGDAAADMRIKPDTARAYLKQIFAKTDVHRQADLIQLLVRYQRAVRGDFQFRAG